MYIQKSLLFVGPCQIGALLFHTATKPSKRFWDVFRRVVDDVESNARKGDDATQILGSDRWQ